MLHLCLLLFRIDRHSLWLDEVMSLDVATRSWERMAAFFVQLPEQQPVYYLVLRAWLAFGSSEFVLRSFSALCALASLWVLFFLARELFDTAVARVAAVLFCFAPYFLYYGQEARMYTLLALLVLGNSLLLVRWLKRRHPAMITGYAATAIVGVYTHIFFFFLLAAHLAFVVGRDRSLSPVVVRVLLTHLTTALLYVPWLLLILARGPESQEWKGAAHVIFGLPYTLLRFSIGYAEVVANHGWKERAAELLAQNASLLLVATICFGGLALAGLRHLAARGESGWFVIACLTVPPLLALLGSAVVILVGDRYLMVSFPFYVLLLAAGFVQLLGSAGRWRWIGATLAVLYVAVVGRALTRYYFSDEFGTEQWAEVAEYLRAHRSPQDPVILHRGYIMDAFRYYYRGEAGRLFRAEQVGPEQLDQAERYWLVLAHPADLTEVADHPAVLDRRYRIASERLFPKQSGIRVLLLERDFADSSGTKPAQGAADARLDRRLPDGQRSVSFP